MAALKAANLITRDFEDRPRVCASFLRKNLYIYDVIVKQTTSRLGLHTGEFSGPCFPFQLRNSDPIRLF